MPFPISERVIYQKNPLVAVICQLRFPTILKIDSESPVAFQESIRQEYPILRDNTEGQLQLPQQIQQQIPANLRNILVPSGSKVYEFLSEDEDWVIGLTKDFIALTTHSYEKWDMFRDRLNSILEAFVSIYQPAFFSRIGLRYQNVIRRTDLELSVDTPWSELLESYIAGELTDDSVSEMVQDITKNLLINLTDVAGQVRIQHGYVRDEDSQEICYLIDNDFFTRERIKIDAAYIILDKFNASNRNLFRWCNKDRLHDAMGPTPTGRFYTLS
jgi:uncharacterized protein (TIGR04255 family)